MTREQLDRLVSCLRPNGSDYMGYNDGLSLHRDDLNSVEQLFEKSYKYRWHDLRKNPNDLPNRDSAEQVLIKRKYRYGTAFKCLVGKSFADEPEDEKIIAWCEI